jgi:ribosomal protein S8
MGATDQGVMGQSVCRKEDVGGCGRADESI